MKKILKTGLLFLLAAPCLAACGQSNGPAVDLNKLAQNAINNLGVAYGEYAQTNGISLAGGKVIKEFTVDNHVFGFDYTVTTTGTYKYEYLKLTEDKLEVKIPTFADLNADGTNTITYAAYQLNAKVTYKGVVEGEKEDAKSQIDKVIVENKTWNIRINAETVEPVWQKLSEARKKENGETVVTTGYVCAIMNNKDDSEYQNGVWLADGDAGMMLYGSALTAYFGALHIGDKLMVIGTASPYNGLFEVKPTKLAIVDSTPEDIAPTVFKKCTEADLKAMTVANCSDPVEFENVTIVTDLTGKLAENSTAITIKVKIGETEMTYYVNKHTNTAERQALIDLINANKGKTCTLKTVMGYNSGTLQFTAAMINEGGSICDNIIFAK
ncbi:MAG: hypothetical protein MJ217_02330 [Bacilli bacterium]|nr:hypothetical protein [Bacilli bacterium]